MNRRNFLKLSLTAAAATALPLSALAATRRFRNHEIYVFRTYKEYARVNVRHGWHQKDTQYKHHNVELTQEIDGRFVVVARKKKVLPDRRLTALPTIYGFAASSVYDTTTNSFIKSRSATLDQIALRVAEGRA